MGWIFLLFCALLVFGTAFLVLVTRGASPIQRAMDKAARQSEQSNVEPTEALHQTKCPLFSGFRGALLGLGLLTGGVLSTLYLLAWLAWNDFPNFQRGRAHRRKGRPQLPTARRSEAWHAPMPPLERNEQAAAAWRGNAATELASVAAFGYVALELVALGAPPALIEAAHQDALDEVRHARLCYGVAASFDGTAHGPAPFAAAVLPPERPTTLHAVCIDALVESAWLERASALVAAELAECAEHAPLRDVLREIALDEARHADHGMDVLHWGLGRDASLHAALLSAWRSARVEAHVPSAPDGLVRVGIADQALWRTCLQQAHDALGAWLLARSAQCAA